jgi:hypothetical protein
MHDFFISYNKADKSWAEWIAWVLEENGQTDVIQSWDILPGGNFVLEMQRAAIDCDRTIAVLSEDYLNSASAQPEWAAILVKDPQDAKHKLLPIRVRPCEPQGLLRSVAYVDLVGKSERDAESTLLSAIVERPKPTTRPLFPEVARPASERSSMGRVRFPGTGFRLRGRGNKYKAYLRNGRALWKEDHVVPPRQNGVSPQRRPLQSIWDALPSGSLMDTMAQVHAGIHYKTGLAAECVDDNMRPGFAPGIATVESYFEPYLVGDYQYLCTKTEVMRDKSYLFDWDQPKVLVNRVRTSRGIWNMSGAVDEQGLLASRQFHGMWPKAGVPVELLSAIISGPVANAYIFDHSSGREIRIRSIKQIPVPRFTDEQTDFIVSLVQDYYSQRGQWIAEPEREKHYRQRCLELLYWIDAVVLEAYALPPTLERLLLDQFDVAERRPLPFGFPGYGEEYERAKVALREEKAYRSLLKQYHALVDKKYMTGLTPTETEDMERLGRETDAHNAPFYDSIFEMLSVGKK